MNEMLSTHTKIMIETLLNVHALANMLRASGNEEYRRTAAGWLPNLEWQMTCLKRELEPALHAPPSEEEHPNAS